MLTAFSTTSSFDPWIPRAESTNSPRMDSLNLPRHLKPHQHPRKSLPVPGWIQGDPQLPYPQGEGLREIHLGTSTGPAQGLEGCPETRANPEGLRGMTRDGMVGLMADLGGEATPQGCSQRSGVMLLPRDLPRGFGEH